MQPRPICQDKPAQILVHILSAIQHVTCAKHNKFKKQKHINISDRVKAKGKHRIKQMRVGFNKPLDSAILVPRQMPRPETCDRGVLHHCWRGILPKTCTSEYSPAMQASECVRTGMSKIGTLCSRLENACQPTAEISSWTPARNSRFKFSKNV